MEFAAVLVLLVFGHVFASSPQQHHGSSKEGSYKCSAGEKQFQWENIDLVSPHICEPFGMMTPWQLTQMIYPDIKVFIDIGANRGYTAGEFFGLWSPGHGFNRRKLMTALEADQRDGILKNKDQINTYCQDGSKEDKPMICIGNYKSECQTRRDITVYSFDGQKTHVRESTTAVNRHFPHLNVNYTVDPKVSNVKATWVYTHAAMTDFLLPDQKFGFFKVVTHEGGQLIKDQKVAEPGTDLVPLLTVDLFCEQNNIKHVPILKIDAEGHDIEVMHGANHTLLHRGVKVINYECWECMSEKWQKAFHSLDVDYGFDCYQIGQYNLFAKVTNCWDFSVAQKAPECTESSNPKCPEYIKWFEPRKRLDGNGMCVHRHRGAALHAMFESMSLYQYYNNRRGHVYRDAVLSNMEAKYDNKGVISMSASEKSAFTRRTGRNPLTGAKEWEKAKK